MKNSASYYDYKFMVGESIVIEYSQPISLANNAMRLISLKNGSTPIDMSLRAVDNTLIITPLNSNYKSAYLYLTIGKGAIKSKSNSTVTNSNEFYYINVAEERYGDIDGDGKVNALDLASIASSYNSLVDTDSRWSLKKDLNRDGIIDIYDLSCMGRAVNVKWVRIKKDSRII